MLRSMRFLVMASVLGLAPVPSQAQNVPWIGYNVFPEPLYLVVCVPTQYTVACPMDGMALIPDATLYPNLALRVLGGPFTQRWQVENMRASLVRQGMPTHAMWIYIVNRAGTTLGGFWMGSMPVCQDRHAEGPLSGDVIADFSPTGGRPDTFPVTEDAFGAYMNYVQQTLRPECEERQRRRQIFSDRPATSDGSNFGSPPGRGQPCDRPPCGEPLRMRPD